MENCNEDNIQNEQNETKLNKVQFDEIKELEQYFFTENVLITLIDSLLFEENIVCLCTPAVADAFWQIKKKEVWCLDIDERFNYLPKFIKFIVLSPEKIEIVPNVIIIDPPFFKIKLIDLYNTVEMLTGGNKSIKIIAT